MMKRMLSLVLALMLTMGLAATALAVDDSVPAEAGYYYVYTENGKNLYVREDPRGRIVGSLKYGTRIHVDAFVDENWALILYTYNKPGFGTAEYAAYVNRRFLTRNKPAARPKNGDTPTPAPEILGDAMTELNNEYRTAKKVELYEVTLRPTRVTGWVPVHWGPSTETEIMATYRANIKLQVIQETANWLQVMDVETGNVGFVNKRFVAQ